MMEQRSDDIRLSDREREGFLERGHLVEIQNARLARLAAEVLGTNGFYRSKLGAAGVRADSIKTLEDLPQLPFTTKTELAADQTNHPRYGSILTYRLERYARMHQTSGTSGRALRWLDTPASWSWLLDAWQAMLRIAGIRTEDRLFFPFSFGPFLGFWTAFEAAARAGRLCLAGGGMSSTARIRALIENQATVIFSTPTYALHLAEVAAQEHIDLTGRGVRAIIVAGEPGAGIPETRAQIEKAWGARVFDHYGLTEVGAVGIECPENPVGLHVLETEYIAEIVDPLRLQPAEEGQTGELVLTNFGRDGSPLLRYRTGDMVRKDLQPCPCGRSLLRLAGGIVGRNDDMIHVRGNNLYPSAIEAVIRRFPEVAEFRIEVDQTDPLAEVRIEVEPVLGGREIDIAERVAQAIRDQLLFRAEVRTVEPGTLPRFELKARRFRMKA